MTPIGLLREMLADQYDTITTDGKQLANFRETHVLGIAPRWRFDACVRIDEDVSVVGRTTEVLFAVLFAITRLDILLKNAVPWHTQEQCI